MTEKMLKRLRLKYETDPNDEKMNGFYREKLLRLKSKFRIPFIYNSFFSSLVVIYSIYITAKFASGSNGIKENMGPLMGAATIILAITIAFLGFLAFYRVPVMSYIMIVVYILIFVVSITSTGDNVLWFGGERLAEFAPEMKKDVSFSYPAILPVFTIIGFAMYIWSQMMVYEYQYLETLEGFPYFNDRAKKKEYIPIGYIPVELRKSEMDDISNWVPEEDSGVDDAPTEPDIDYDMEEVPDIYDDILEI